MGFVSKLFNSLLGGGISSAATTSANTTNSVLATSARDILPCTRSAEPESAIMGDSAKKKKGGVSTLLVE